MKSIKSILLDSGAYSSWGLGRPIRLVDYIQFVKLDRTLLHGYVNLDVIPGIEGQRAWRPEVIEAAAAASYRNQQIMKDSGLSPIPVFHQDESFLWLEKSLRDGEPYIALSPSKLSGRHDILRWLHRCFGLIDRSVKVHGLGVTSALICQQFPWTSVDSGRWFISASNGQIAVPYYNGGRPDYTLPPKVAFATDRTRGHRDHVDRSDDHARISRFLENEVGVSLEDCRDSKLPRMLTWLTYFKGLEKASGVKLFQVTNLEREQTEALNSVGIEHRLISFFQLTQIRDDALVKYLDGYVPARRTAAVPKIKVIKVTTIPDPAPITVPAPATEATPAPVLEPARRHTLLNTLPVADLRNGEVTRNKVAHPDSVEKLLDQLAGLCAGSVYYQSGRRSKDLTKNVSAVLVAPSLFRRFHCAPGCTACCRKFTLDYLPDEMQRVQHCEGFKERRVTVNGITRIIYTNDQSKNARCDFLRVTRPDGGLGCANYSSLPPLSCISAPQLSFRYHENGFTTVAKQPYGRGWAWEQEPQCEFIPFENPDEIIPELQASIVLLDRFAAWARYFELDAKIEPIREYLLQAIDSKRGPKSLKPVWERHEVVGRSTATTQNG